MPPPWTPPERRGGNADAPPRRRGPPRSRRRRHWGAAAAAAAVAGGALLLAAATRPRGADGALTVRPLPPRAPDGGGGAAGGGAPREVPSAVATDGDGAVYVAGTLRVAPSTAAGGSTSVFLLKVSPLGDVLWRTDVASGGVDAVGGLAVAAGGVYVVVTTNGHFRGVPTGGGGDVGDGSGGGGGGGPTPASAGGGGTPADSSYDGAVLRFATDAPAPPQWVYQRGTSAADAYTAVAVRAGGASVYVAGYTRGDQFAPAAGLRDVAIAQLNVSSVADGPALLRGVQWGTAADEQASALAIAADGTVYVAVQEVGVAAAPVVAAADAADGSGAASAAAAVAATGAAGSGTRDRLVVYQLDGDLVRRLQADGSLAPGMEVLAQSSFVASSLAAGASGRVYAAGVASVADGRRDDGLLALFNLTAGHAPSATAAATPAHQAVVVWNESAPAASERAVSVMVERGGNVVLVGSSQPPSSAAARAWWVMAYDPLGRLLYEDVPAGGGDGVGAPPSMEPRNCHLDVARTSFFCVGLLVGGADAAAAGGSAFGRYDWTVELPLVGALGGGGGVGGGSGSGGGGGGSVGSAGTGGVAGEPTGDDASGVDAFLSKRLHVVLLLVGAAVGGLLLGALAVGTVVAASHRRRVADKAVAESYFADEDGSAGGGDGSTPAASSASAVSDSPFVDGLPSPPALPRPPSPSAGQPPAEPPAKFSRHASGRSLTRPPSLIDQKLVGSASFFSASGAVPGAKPGGGGPSRPLGRSATHSGALPGAVGARAVSPREANVSIGQRSLFFK